MKDDVGITRNSIPDKDSLAWMHYVRLVENRTNRKAPDFVEFAEKVFKQYPELSNKMVWGNYLIADIDEKFMDFQIDSPNPDKIIQIIITLAKEYGFVA